MFEISTGPSPTICLFLSLLYLISSVSFTLNNWPMLVLVSQDFKGFLLFFSDFSYRPGQKQHCLHRRRSLPGPKGTVQISLSVFTTYKQRWTNLLQNKINYPYFSKYSVIGIIIEKKLERKLEAT